MFKSIAHLGPPGTHAESAALAYRDWFAKETGQELELHPYPSIPKTLYATAEGKADLVVVPAENSIEGSVTMTMDAIWKLEVLKVQQALILPIFHALISRADNLAAIRQVYSHPQALAQCQYWLEQFLPAAQVIPANSTTEALQHLTEEPQAAAISSERAAQLYNLPVIACPINDYPDNYTRFWVLSLQPSPGGNCTSLAFSVPANVPGALVKTLQIFAHRGINLSRIESRPTKRSLGDYVFFIDLEANATEAFVQSALDELKTHTEILKIFGSYNLLPI